MARPARTGLTLPRDFRLSGSLFDRVFNEGRRASSSGLLLVAAANSRASSRFGVSLGRRFGPAHRRNRARRLLKEAFRLDLDRLPEGFDMVAVPRGSGFPDTLQEVRRLLCDVGARAARATADRDRKDAREGAHDAREGAHDAREGTR